MCYSARGPSTPSTPVNSKRVKNEDDSSADDLTKDLEEPTPEPIVQEVSMAKIGKRLEFFPNAKLNSGEDVRDFVWVQR